MAPLSCAVVTRIVLRTVTGVLMAASVAATAGAQPADRLAQIAQSYADRGLFSGSVLVARDGEVLLSKGFGLASVEWGVPNAPDVRYLLASVSKQFTAAAVLRLVDQGRLGLDDPVSRHLPDTPPAWSAVTVRQLLAHTSGIPNHTEDADFPRIQRERFEPRALMALFRDRPLDFAPGSRMRYSNSGYIVLGVLIETVGGLPYDRFVATQLLQPLGLADAGVARSPDPIPRLATGYAREGRTLRRADFLDMSVPYAAGALYGTTGDLLAWQRGLYGGRLLSEASLRAMTTPVLAGYALGLGVGQGPDGPVYAHSGGIHGFSTWLQYEPATRLTVAVLANVEGAATGSLAQRLAAAAHGRPVTLPEERRAVALPPEALASVEGAYRAEGTPTLWFVRRGDALWASLAPQAWQRVEPQSATVFYVPGADAEVRFTPGPDGRATAVTVLETHGDRPWPRVAATLPSFTAQPVYLRGSMNDWSTGDALQPGPDGVLRVAIDLPAGRHAFKIATADWQTLDLGRPAEVPDLHDEGTLALAGRGRNIELAVSRPSRCDVSVDGRDIVEPRLRVSCRAR